MQLVNIDREDYDLSAWTNDTINLIKKRKWFSSKGDAFLFFQENIVEMLQMYSEGLSPRDAYEEFNDAE